MPLLLLDLDNTLLPRDAAFRAWAEDFLTENDLPPGDLDWLVMLDGSGYVPRSTVLGAARRRYGFDRSLDSMLAHYRVGINSRIQCPDSHIAALRQARAAGWTLGIVSNGGTLPQLEKIRLTGLASLVDGWVISEEARYLKPDPMIFEIAARRCGFRPAGDWTAQTWMVGDYGPADIAGAAATGLRSVWLHHGRPWAERAYRPTVSAPNLPEAVRVILGAAERPTAGRGFAAAAAGRTLRRGGRLAVPASRLAPPPMRVAPNTTAAPAAPAATATTATATATATRTPLTVQAAVRTALVPGMPLTPPIRRAKAARRTPVASASAASTAAASAAVAPLGATPLAAAPSTTVAAQTRWDDATTAAS